MHLMFLQYEGLAKQINYVSCTISVNNNIYLYMNNIGAHVVHVNVS